jgi:uncharacterized protein (TIGR00288 family)
MITSPGIALLIDAENISPTLLNVCMKQLNSQNIQTKRAYGDWSKLNHWKPTLAQWGIEAVHQPSYVSGKNTTDIRLAVDAMELCYRQGIRRFALFSSDSDFTPLVQRLKECGALVIGFGEQKTPRIYVTSCYRFIYLDRDKLDKDKPKVTPDLPPPTSITSTSAKADPLPANSKQTSVLPADPLPASPKLTPILTKEDLPRLLVQAYRDLWPTGNPWVEFEQLRAAILKRYPPFHPKHFDSNRVITLFQNSHLFEMEKFAPNPKTPQTKKWRLKLKIEQARAKKSAS